jgi:hypothetical protein
MCDCLYIFICMYMCMPGCTFVSYIFVQKSKLDLARGLEAAIK